MPLIPTTVYAKSANGPAALGVANLEEDEHARLREEWTKWLEVGSPRGGTYRYRLGKTDDGKEVSGFVLLRFDEVAAIL